jgi:hypothetical protein
MLSEENGRLFDSGDAEALADLQTRVGIRSIVDAIRPAEFDRKSTDDLVSTVIDRLTAHPLILDEEKLRATHKREVAVSPGGTSWDLLEVAMSNFTPGLRVRYSIPYTGSSSLWRLRPRASMDEEIRGNVRAESSDRGELDLILLTTADDPLPALQEELERELEKIRTYVGALNEIIENATRHMPAQVRDAIAKRRRRRDALAALPAPDVKDDPESRSHEIELVRDERVTAEAMLSLSDRTYTAILGIIRDFGRGLEAFAQSVQTLGEEPIRHARCRFEHALPAGHRHRGVFSEKR